jgi:hypothetical protein
MKENGDGEEPWSEDDLFGLDSALSFGANIGEIAFFLRREVEDVERKAFKRNRPNSANPRPIVPNRPNSLAVDFEIRPAASSEATKPIWNAAGFRRETDVEDAKLKPTLETKRISPMVERVGVEFRRLRPAGSGRRPW